MNNIYHQSIDMAVTVNGRPTKVHSHESKYFIESREGSEYSIVINNRNNFRIEVVAAVDGLSVISGKPASTADSGYIVNAYGSLNIKGFRKDSSEVGAFKFTKKEASYAAEKGSASNVGIIAIAIYSEVTRYYTATVWDGFCNFVPSGSSILGKSNTPGAFNTATSLSLGAATNASYSSSNTSALRSVNFDHGTTWGTKIQDQVTTATFERKPQAFCIFEVFYNSRENLEAMGIQIIPEKIISFPKGFPQDYATPPKGWCQ